MSYLRRQVITAALTANAIRPAPGVVVSVPAMFGGWLVGEMAPHFLAETAADTAREAWKCRRGAGGNRAAMALGAANFAGLAYVLRQGHRSQHIFESSLTEGLGEDYRGALGEKHDDLDWKTPLAHLVYPFRMVNPDVEIIKNLPYWPDHGRRGLLDVYRPRKNVEGAPVLLQVHGGGWTIGNKDQQGLPLMKHLASRGWVCVAINYRLSPRSAFPAHIIDIKRSIAWIKEHIAEYGGDPEFIAITGGSAGGHLTALTALTANDPEYQPGFEDADTSVQAAVPFYGIYDFAGVTGSKAVRYMRDRFLATVVMQTRFRDDPAAFEKASPILRVRQDAPPFYVIHGSNDVFADVQQARAFVEALREASDQAVAYSELRLTQHAFDVFPSVRSQHSVRSVDRFLRWAHDKAKGQPVAESDDSWEAGDPQDDERA